MDLAEIELPNADSGRFEAAAVLQAAKKRSRLPGTLFFSARAHPCNRRKTAELQAGPSYPSSSPGRTSQPSPPSIRPRNK